MERKKTFYGEIGKNVPVNRAEKEEDLLEQMYLCWKAGEPLQPEKLMKAAGIRSNQFDIFRKRMVRHGYLDTASREGDLTLTEFGINQGAECVFRHRNLTQFLQMISGIGYNEAEQNACRLEHFIDKRVIEGIVGFVRYGHTYDQLLKNYDLNNLFDTGNYRVCLSIYEPEKRSPRILAPEQKWLYNEPVMEIREQNSRFALEPRHRTVKDLDLYYRQEGEWKKTAERDHVFLLPTVVLEYLVSPELPTIEGSILIAFSKKGSRVSETDCRELNIHICR